MPQPDSHKAPHPPAGSVSLLNRLVGGHPPHPTYVVGRRHRVTTFTAGPFTICSDLFLPPLLQSLCNWHGHHWRHSSWVGWQDGFERRRDRPGPIPGVAAYRDVCRYHDRQVLGGEPAFPGTTSLMENTMQQRLHFPLRFRLTYWLGRARTASCIRAHTMFRSPRMNGDPGVVTDVRRVHHLPDVSLTTSYRSGTKNKLSTKHV